MSSGSWLSDPRLAAEFSRLFGRGNLLKVRASVCASARDGRPAAEGIAQALAQMTETRDGLKTAILESMRAKQEDLQKLRRYRAVLTSRRFRRGRGGAVKASQQRRPRARGA